MAAWLWQNDDSEIGVREAVGDDDTLELCVSGVRRALLSPEQANALASALRQWSRQPMTAPEGVYFQVYYTHEYANDDGWPVPCTALGEPDEDHAYTWDEADLGAVRQRVAEVGRLLSELHHRETGAVYGPNVNEAARAWVSIFRMPDDVRIWKGFWDDLDDTDLCEDV